MKIAKGGINKKMKVDIKVYREVGIGMKICDENVGRGRDRVETEVGVEKVLQIAIEVDIECTGQ